MSKRIELTRRKLNFALICGMLGCLCFGAGDWLMIYGDTTYSGSLYWLTEGVADIAPWRNGLAMVLSFPGIILYGCAVCDSRVYQRESASKGVRSDVNAR